MSLSAADKIEIQELVARYNRAIDSGDVEGWVDTFVRDGVFEGLVVPTFRGHDELRAFVTAFWTEPEYAEWRGAQALDHQHDHRGRRGPGDPVRLRTSCSRPKVRAPTRRSCAPMTTNWSGWTDGGCFPGGGSSSFRVRCERRALPACDCCRLQQPDEPAGSTPGIAPGNPY